MENDFRILLTSTDYRPNLGGVASCAFETTKALSRIEGVKARLITKTFPGKTYDDNGTFEVIRHDLGKSTITSTVRLAYFIDQEIRRFKPHAILNYLWYPGGLATVISPSRLFRRIPFFFLVHGMEIMESKSTLKKRIRAQFSFIKRFVFREPEKIFAVSNFTKNLVQIQCDQPKERIEVINNGVNPQEFYPKIKSVELLKSLKIEGKKVFLSTTRLDSYKGVDRALSALRFVIGKYPDVVYIVCGDGSDRGRLEKIARHYRVHDHVIFTGLIPFEKRIEFYNLADVFILLSRLDRDLPSVEGFGLVFLEAAACGKPSIATWSGGIPDAVIDGETGWLVDPSDPRSVAAAMIDSLSNPEKTRQFGFNAQRRACQQLTWDISSKKIFEEMKRYVRN